MRRFLWLALVLALPHTAQALSEVTGGSTSVLLDPEALAAAGLTVSGLNGPVLVPGMLGDDSVAFPINSRSETPPTTFSYDPSDFAASASGTIEHMGSVLFNMGAIEVGDFSVFGISRGFVVMDNLDLDIILFDIDPMMVSPMDNSLVIAGDLLVSPEFAQALMGAGLTTLDLTGADAGDVLVGAEAVPEPSTGLMLGVGLAAFAARRRVS